MVAKRNKIHLPEIKKWAEKQGEIEKYKVFKKKCREEGFNTKALWNKIYYGDPFFN